MTTDEELRILLSGDRPGKETLEATLRWVEVISVNEEEKTMDAKGIVDELEYYNIQLGAGSIVIYPTVATLCLVGIVERLESNCFLISATEVDKIEITSSTEIILNGGMLGGMVKVQGVTDRLNLIEKDINQLKQGFASWSPIAQDGGKALKTMLTSYFGSKLVETKVEDIENKKVKQ